MKVYVLYRTPGLTGPASSTARCFRPRLHGGGAVSGSGSVKQAALAYDLASLAEWGEFANPNFLRWER